MSKLRSLSTAFWSDPFIEELSPSEKLLFIYLITNEKTNMLGIYESSIKKISFETGIPSNTITEALKKFEINGKVKYSNNYVILVNFMKHQNFNPNMMKSAIDVYNNLPNELKDNDIKVDKSDHLKGFETLLKHFGMVSKYEVEDEIEDELEKENNIDSRKLKFASTLQPFLLTYGKDFLNDFYKYWTEPNKSNTKFKQELEKTWSLERRLETWAKNEKNFERKVAPKESKAEERSRTNMDIIKSNMEILKQRENGTIAITE